MAAGPGGTPADVVVVGGGVAGGLLALALAELGLAVTLVDGPAAEAPMAADPQSATALSYGAVVAWAAPPDPLGRLMRGAPGAWRALERRHGPLGWRRCGLRLWGPGTSLSGLLPLPAAQVETTRFLARLPDVLAAAEVRLLRGHVTAIGGPGAPASGGAGGWTVQLSDGPSLQARQLVLAAGSGSRTLWPELPGVLRVSWAGVLRSPGRALAAAALPRRLWVPPGLEAARSGQLVLPARFQRPALERRAAALERQEWVVDGGLVPHGDGLLLGQLSLVRPGLACGGPPDPATGERQLRQALAALDPRLRALPATYAQRPVAFCSDGAPLVGPLPGCPGLWVFTGFSGAFSQVPVLAPRLARALRAAAAGPHTGPEQALAELARLGVLPQHRSAPG